MALSTTSTQPTLPESPIAPSTPQAIADFYKDVADVATPSIDELHTLYRFYGSVLPHRQYRTVFAFEALGITVVFQNRSQAWEYWKRNREALARIAKVKPLDF